MKKILFLTVFIFVLLNNIYALDRYNFTGIWKCKSTINSIDDAYIAITQINTSEYFIIFINPFWDHQLDYSEYGILIENNYISIHSKEHMFFIEITQLGSLYHYWNSLDDPYPSRFEKISDIELSANILNNNIDYLLLLFKSLE
ncbi:MAG: hypothetical protein FWD47_02995 [Treponema sp.]|nr:hypothetical protein [Treponema sp.]